MSLSFYKSLVDDVYGSDPVEIVKTSSTPSPRALGWPAVNSNYTRHWEGYIEPPVPSAVATVTEAALNSGSCHWVGNISTASIGTAWLNFVAYTFLYYPDNQDNNYMGPVTGTEYWYVRKSGTSYQFTTQMIISGSVPWSSYRTIYNAYRSAIQYSLGAKLMNV